MGYMSFAYVRDNQMFLTIHTILKEDKITMIRNNLLEQISL